MSSGVWGGDVYRTGKSANSAMVGLVNDLSIIPSQVRGCLRVPSSKSQSLRAILFAALAKGESRIERCLVSPDIDAMIKAVQLLGVDVKPEGDGWRILGCAGNLRAPSDVIDCGNSGIVLRFIGALAGLVSGYTVLTGDESIRSRRLSQPLLDGLNQLGAFAVSTRNNGYAPLVIKGKVMGGKAILDGEDSQPISGLLIAGAFGEHPVELQVVNAGEKPWVDLTLGWLKRFGIPYEMRDHQFYRVEGGASLEGFTYIVPGDFSTAAFPIAAAVVTGSELELENLDMEELQGDKAVISVLKKMGARISVKGRSLRVEKGSLLSGMRIDVNDFIDALPILAVVGCFAEGRTEIVNGSIARKKECDRIAAIALELKKMGAKIEEKEDGLVVERSILRGAMLQSHEDHRIAMSLCVAALGASSPSIIYRAQCIQKTYPMFLMDFQAIGGGMG